MAGPARPEDDSMGEEEPEVEEEEEEEVPEDDFFEADASAELTEDEDQGEEYESDDDAEVDHAAAKEIAKKERERLKNQEKMRKEQVEKMRSQLNTDAAHGEAARGKKRLEFLLKQAEVFQHFAPVAASAEEKKKKRGRHGGFTEEQEDQELLRDEEEEGEMAGHRLQVQPSIIGHGKMREYQIQGLNWLIHLYDNGINGILADEMGLGKTLQTISLLAYLREFRGITGPHMIIVPKSTLHNWLAEFRRWCPVIKAVKFHGNAEVRQHQKDTLVQPGKFDVVVTSYEMVIKEKNHWKKFHWRYIIIDEAHRIKNENSILSKVVRMLRTNYRLLITGTPLQNNLHELWALLNFLLPEVFSSAEKFDEWFQISSTGEGGKEGEAEVVQQLHKVLRPFLLRRLKSDVEKSLPPKKETILKIGMSDMQRKYYAALLQKDMEAVTGGADRSRLLNIVMQLRKCCNHPYLFQGAEPGPPYLAGEHLVENSGKMVLLDKLLPKLKSRGSRVLIFSQMTRMIDILEDYCMYRGYGYCRIDGNTSGDDRESQIDDYNSEGSDKFVFLLSTRAGGLGINLYTADIVVLYDSDWNPQMDLQAMDRAHRIGQKKEVQVFRFATENSIEEKVIEKAYKKLRLDALVIQQGRLVENTKSVNKDDLLSMVRYGAEMVFSSEPSKITAEDIDDIIKKGETSTAELNGKLQNFSENAMKFTMDGGMSVYEFEEKEKEPENVDQVDQLKQLMGANWVDPPKRDRKRVISYAENQAAARKGEAKPAGPRLTKMPNLPDYQFYNTARLTELYKKQEALELFAHEQSKKEAAMRAAGSSDEIIVKELAPTPEDPQPLTDAELAERDELLGQGLSNWSRRDFNAFVRACERHGRTALAEIAKEVEGKTEQEVRDYAAIFFSRGPTHLNDAERIFKNIERGEQRIQRQEAIMHAIAAKLDKYKNPWQELKLQYGPAKGKAYTEEEDRFLVCMMHKLGYGAWDELKAEVRNTWRFRFDWYIKSRTPQELARRCETLIRLIEKENEEDEERTAAKKKAGGASKAPSEAPAAAGATGGGKKRKDSAVADGEPSGKKGKE
ncbi:hypothetical protein Ndes2526B_g08720 [Nannochloris sp. 'desiccata']|nr:putative ISWI chromatin-remodeling complex ATPase CHR11 [Chlorella desiccata (nom. nud.)]